MQDGKLIFVSPRFAEGPTVGGAETLLKASARHARAMGFKVTFLTTCARDHFTWRNELESGARNIDGLDVHFFRVDEDRDIGAFLRVQDAISRRGIYSLEDEKTWLVNSVNSRALCDYLRREADNCDWIIIGPYLFGLSYFAARIRPAKTILAPCLHDEGFAYARSFREMFRDAAGIMFNSGPEMDLGQKLYGLPAEKCAVVGMGMDFFEAPPELFAEKHDFHEPYLIYSGRREAGKGIPLLLDYFSLFRQRQKTALKMVFTGSGRIDPPPGLEPHILDLGFVAEEKKRAAMAGAVAFCHPSVNESFGIVLLESWLARTPALVHARCAVNHDHCRKSNGGLWFASYPEFEEELLLLAGNRNLRDRMGRAGRDYVLREYDWKNIESKFCAALDQFAEKFYPPASLATQSSQR
ncbi:MAG: glycosyltransferase family 4 protein [Kiritimatiellae bacterium]|nr:glycosyltransferase family 4 protein [Kiritimatiellia bacterium]